MYGCVLRVDVGIHAQRDRARSCRRARRPRSSSSSSAADSTLKQRMPAASAASISAAVLPTPENTVFAGSPPAAITRASSPPDTMSKPLPDAREEVQDSEVGVRLDRVADEVRNAGERARRTRDSRLRAPRANRRSTACRSARRSPASGTPSAWSSPSTTAKRGHGFGVVGSSGSARRQRRRRRRSAARALAAGGAAAAAQRSLDAARRQRRPATASMPRCEPARRANGRRNHVTSSGILAGTRCASPR